MIAVARGARITWLAALVLMSVAQALLAVAGAVTIQRLFDATIGAHAAPGAPFPAALFALLALFALCGGLIEIARAWTAERLGLGYVNEVRALLFRRLLAGSAYELGQRPQASVLLPFLGDLTAIRKWISDGLVRAISGALMAAVLIGALALRSPALAAAIAVIVAAAILAMARLSGALALAVRATRRERGNVANFVTSTVRTAQTVQAFDRVEREARRLAQRSAALMRESLRLATLSGTVGFVVQIAAAALIVVTLALGAWEVRQGAMTTGVIVGVLSLVGLLSTAVRDLGHAFELWRRAAVSFEKVRRALATRAALDRTSGKRRVREGAASVALNNVSVRGLFSEVSAKARPGAVVQIAGASGAGKSTLLMLAARIRDPDAGDVLIGGADARQLDFATLRRRVGIASAAVPLMRGSLRMNLRYRGAKISGAEIRRVRAICGLDAIFARFADGEAARIVEGGPELSESERCQLLIARAMLGSPPILILDDVDGPLDAERASALADAVRAYPGVVLMTARSPALIAAATEIWRLRDGRVTVESPPPAPVIAFSARDTRASTSKDKAS